MYPKYTICNEVQTSQEHCARCNEALMSQVHGHVWPVAPENAKNWRGWACAALHRALYAGYTLSLFVTNMFFRFQIFRFQCSGTNSQVLKGISIVDTPGILSGEKQRTGGNGEVAGVYIMCRNIHPWERGGCTDDVLLRGSLPYGVPTRQFNWPYAESRCLSRVPSSFYT